MLRNNSTKRLPSGKRELIPTSKDLPDENTIAVHGQSVRPRSLKRRMFPFLLTMLVALMISLGTLTGFFAGLGDDITVVTPQIHVIEVEPTTDAQHLAAMAESNATATVVYGGAAVHNEASEAVAQATIQASQIDVGQHEAIVEATKAAAAIAVNNQAAVGAATATAAAVQSAAVARSAERESDVQAVVVEATKAAIYAEQTIQAYGVHLRMDAMRNDALRQFERQATIASIGNGSASTLAVVVMLAVVVGVLRHNWNDDTQRIVARFTARFDGLKTWRDRATTQPEVSSSAENIPTITPEPVEQYRPAARSSARSQTRPNTATIRQQSADDGRGGVVLNAKKKEPENKLIRFTYHGNAGYYRQIRFTVPTPLYKKLSTVARVVLADDKLSVSRRALSGIVTQAEHKQLLDIMRRYEMVTTSNRATVCNDVGRAFFEQLNAS